MKTILSFVKNSATYIAGSVLSRAIGFLMLPILTAYIPPRQMGYYDLSIVYVTLAYEFLFMNIWVVVLRYMHDGEGEGRGRALAPGLLVFIGSATLYLATAGMVALIFAPDYLWLIAGYGLCVSLSYLTGYFARGVGRNADFAMSGIINAVVTAGLNLWLLVGAGFDVSALYVAGIVGYLVQSLYLEVRVGVIRRLKRDWFKAVDRTSFIGMLRYALPIGFTALVYWFINSFNRLVINDVLTLEENGIFAVAARWGSLLAIILTAMSFAWQDIAFRRGEDGRFFGRAATLYISALALAVSALLPAVKLVFPWFVNANYYAALPIVPTTLFVAALSGHFNFVVSIFYAAKSSRNVLYGALAAAVINVAFTFPLVSLWGLQGANVATMCAFLVGIVTLQLILRRRIALRFDYLRALLSFVVPAISAFIFWNGGIGVNLTWLLGLLVVGSTGATWWFRRERRRV